MYISSLPLVMSLRQTNNYEEKSIGLDKGEAGGGGLGSHLKAQLAYDIWFQIMAWFLIAIIARGQLNSAAPGFSSFNILFEVTSGYGTVGLSTGIPNQDYSLSAMFHTLSKLLMIPVMIRGRHRGLPYAIDRALLVPGEKLMHRLDDEYNRRHHYSGKQVHDEVQEVEEEEHKGDEKEEKIERHQNENGGETKTKEKDQKENEEQRQEGKGKDGEDTGDNEAGDGQKEQEGNEDKNKDDEND